MDSCTTKHTIGRKEWFYELTNAKCQIVIIGDNVVLKVEGIGKVPIAIEKRKGKNIKDILFMLGLKVNFILFSQIKQ